MVIPMLSDNATKMANGPLSKVDWLKNRAEMAFNSDFCCQMEVIKRILQSQNESEYSAVLII